MNEILGYITDIAFILLLLTLTALFGLMIVQGGRRK